jgi:hypothetical protein
MHPAVIDAATLERLISAATAAPSLHDGRPWRFRLDPETLTLEMRTAAGRRYADAPGRAPHLSAGAALFHLRVAVAHFGFEPVVRLLPLPQDPGLLATVRLTVRSAAGPDPYPGLYDVLWRRHGGRRAVSPHRPPQGVMAVLREAARVEGAELALPGAQEAARLLRLSADAELGCHTGTGKCVAGPPVRLRSRLTDLTDLDVTGAGPGTLTRAAVSGPLLAVLATGHDHRADWLRAGQALAYVLLTATVHGLRASLLHPAPDGTASYRPQDGGDPRARHVQVLLRLGYGPEGPTGPRRGARGALDG